MVLGCMGFSCIFLQVLQHAKVDFLMLERTQRSLHVLYICNCEGEVEFSGGLLSVPQLDRLLSLDLLL